MTTSMSAREQRVRERAYELWEQDHARGLHQGPEAYWHQAWAEIEADEAAYDGAVEESFPASDPPAHSGIT
jgi:hypothetical protein